MIFDEDQPVFAHHDALFSPTLNDLPQFFEESPKSKQGPRKCSKRSSTSSAPSRTTSMTRTTSFISAQPIILPLDEITYTPTTHRISKAKKGKKVHACGYPGCPKVFTRAEHRKRHEANHNAHPAFQCQETGCGRPFQRPDLLARHMEKQHDVPLPEAFQGEICSTSDYHSFLKSGAAEGPKSDLLPLLPAPTYSDAVGSISSVGALRSSTSLDDLCYSSASDSCYSPTLQAPCTPQMGSSFARHTQSLGNIRSTSLPYHMVTHPSLPYLPDLTEVNHLSDNLMGLSTFDFKPTEQLESFDLTALSMMQDWTWPQTF